MASAPSRSRPTSRTANLVHPVKLGALRRTSPGNGASRSRSRRPTCARGAATTRRSRSASSSTCRSTTFRSPIASCCAWRAARRPTPVPTATICYVWDSQACRRDDARQRLHPARALHVLESGNDRLNRGSPRSATWRRLPASLRRREQDGACRDRRRRRRRRLRQHQEHTAVSYVSGIVLEP